MTSGSGSHEQPLTRLFVTPPLTPNALSRACISSYRQCLPEVELEKLDSLQGRRFNEYLLSRALLRHALSQTLAPERSPSYWTVSPRHQGPPKLDSLEAKHWRCSLSHSHSRVAVALTNSGACGVDIEAHRARRNRSALAETYFTTGEQSLLADAPDQQRDATFYRIWTLKEAWYKAQEEINFSEVLSGLDFSQPGVGPTGKRGVSAWWTTLDGFSLSVVCSGRPGTLWQGWPGEPGLMTETEFHQCQPFRITP